MRAWEDYGECCRKLAVSDRDARFCPDCGHAFFRCQAPGCGNLLTPLGHCAACLDLRLSLEKTAILQARIGECLSVPFGLRNNGSARSLSVRTVLRNGPATTVEAVPLAWEQLEAGRSRSFAVLAGPFEHSGISNLRLAIVVAARLGDAEETFAFSGDVAIDVEGADPTQIVQHFNLAGADFGTAGMVVANPHAAVAEHRRRTAAVATSPLDVPLERAERVEIERGYRGYERINARIPRHVEFVYRGFPAPDRPEDGPLFQQPVIRCGRNGRAGAGRQTAQPNDLCLRVYDPVSGELDREASTGIPRRVCDFVLQDDRLCVRALSSNALILNDARLDAGDARVVNDGDRVTVSAARGRALALRTTFTVSGGLVTHVRFEKLP